MDIEEEKEEEKDKVHRTYRVKLELPFDVRAFGWAIWNIALGFGLGVAVHNLAVVMGGLR